MQLAAKPFAIACALLWGGAILVIGLANQIVPSYGELFLQVMSSVYPGFHHSGTVRDLLVGAGYGLVDGAVVGLLFAWLYNFCSGQFE
jgi:hypothetical protein